MVALDTLQQKIFSSPILIVDDNEINRIFLKKTLETRGFTNLQAVESAEKALEVLPELKPHMIILDIMMPGGMDGFECCQHIRKQDRYKDTPILIQTSIIEPELRVKAFLMGATDFVSKPVYPDELYSRVMVHLEKRESLQILQVYKSRMDSELDSARLLQQAILPHMEEIQEIQRRCNFNIASYFQPCSEIGGDFWGIKILFPHQVAFWLVDFSGHGVASALNAFRLQAYLKEHSALAARAGEYISHLNDKLLHLLMPGQFATMFYAIADTQTNTLFYASACAPHPIIWRKSTGKAEIIDGSGALLGVGLHVYPTQSIPFMLGDILLLYSDAFTETPDAEGNYITEDDIIRLIEKYHSESSAALKEILLDYFAEHAGGDLRDDLTIAILIRSQI